MQLSFNGRDFAPIEQNPHIKFRYYMQPKITFVYLGIADGMPIARVWACRCST